MHSFSRYFLGPQTRTGLIFGYGAADLSGLKRGLVSLKQVLRNAEAFDGREIRIFTENG